MLHRVAVDTWKLPSMELLVSDIREVFTFVRKNRDPFLLYIENRDPSDPLGLKIYQKQLWLGLSDTLKSLIHHHDLLKSIFHEMKREYPFSGKLPLLKKYQKLFDLVAIVSKNAQNREPECGGVLKGLYVLYYKLEDWGSTQFEEVNMTKSI